MPRRTLVDPRFPGRLRELRRARGLSLRELAEAAYISKSTLSELENRHSGPSVETAQHLDRALNAGGELAAMVTNAPEPEPEHLERVQYVLTRPTAVDLTAVKALNGVLTAHRYLDDVLDSRILLPTADAEWRTVTQLARQARGPAASDARRVAAIWTQYYGWLLAEARQFSAAVQILTEAAREADELNDGVLAAQVENFRGYVERQRENPRGIVRHFLSAYKTPGANILQRVGDAVQAAHGYALLGDHTEARRLLGEASDLTEAADGHAPPDIAYWLTVEFSLMGIGLAHLALGDNTRAADHLRAGLDSLPEGFQQAEWTIEYREALERIVR